MVAPIISFIAHIAQETHYYIHVVNNFQIMISNGGSMKCGGQCENVKLQMGDYSLKTHMFSIEMGGCDIVLGVEWLRTLGPITMDFLELYMSFKKDGHSYTLKGLKVGSLEIVSSHHMEKLLKRVIQALLHNSMLFKPLRMLLN
jgi:hypothetical protein